MTRNKRNKKKGLGGRCLTTEAADKIITAAHAISNENADKHHNYSNPCTNLSAKIYSELFPSLSSGDTNTASSTEGQLLITQQPLLAFMMLRYLIDERKKIRADTQIIMPTNLDEGLLDLQLQRMDEDNNKEKKNDTKPKQTETTTSIDIEEVDEYEIEGLLDENGYLPAVEKKESNGNSEKSNSSNHTKKKKKKKRKKKKKAAGSSTTRDETNENTINGVVEKKDKGVGLVVETLHTAPPSLYETGTDLDTLLDWYIDSEEASNMINNEAMKWGKRDIDSFTAFLSNKFDQEKERWFHQRMMRLQRPSEEIYSDCRALLNSIHDEGLNWKDVLPTISIAKVDEILASVECGSCKVSSTSHFSNLMASESKEVGNDCSSGTSTPRHANTEVVEGVTHIAGVPIEELHQAFDYMKTISVDDIHTIILNEDGSVRKKLDGGVNHDNTSSSLYHLELRSIHQSHLLIMPKEGDSSDKAGSVLDYPIKTTDIINLVKLIIKPRHSTISGEQGDDSDLAKIEKQVRHELRTIQNALASFEKIIKDTNEKVEKSITDFQSMKLQSECDATCDSIFKELGGILLQLFKSVCYTGWTKKYGPKLISFMYSLLNLYNQAMDSLIKPVDEHYNERKSSIDSYLEVIRLKLSVLSKLVIDMSNAVIGSEDGETSSAVVLFALQAYRQSIDESLDNIDIFPYQGGDDLIMQLITARIKLVLHNEKYVYKEACYRREVKHISDTIKGLVNGFDRQPDVKMSDAKIELSILDHQKRKHNASYLRTFKVNMFGRDVCDISKMLEQSLEVIMLWLIVLCKRQFNESSMESLVPPHIDEWLDSIKNEEIAKTDLCRDTGEHRVSSILSGFIYRWLEARCSEWQAELTRDELLQSFRSKEPDVVSKGERKSRKKNESTDLSQADQVVETLVKNRDGSDVETV